MADSRKVRQARIALVCALAIPLFAAVSVFAEPSPAIYYGGDNDGYDRHITYDHNLNSDPPAEPASALSSIRDGAWNDPQTWNLSVIPSSFTVVQITHTVTYNQDLADEPASAGITIGPVGTLQFDQGISSRTLIVAGNIDIQAGGSFVIPPNTGFKSTVKIKCETDGEFGIIVGNGGIFDVKGSEMDYFKTTLSAQADGGQNQINTADITGWNIGDTVTIGPGVSAAPVFESVIVDISGNTITLADSLTENRAAGAEVVNITRNTVITSTGSGRSYIRNLSHTEVSFIMEWAEASYLGMNDAGKYGITFDGELTRGKIDYCSIHNGYIGIRLSGSSGNTLSNNIVYANSLSGIGLYESPDNNILEGNTAYSNTDGIHLSGQRNTLSANVCYSNFSSGINVVNGFFSQLNGNVTYSNSSGIKGNSGWGNELTGNESYLNTTYGINYSNGIGNSISGNTLHSNAGNGMHISSDQDSTFAGNTVYSNNGHGIYLSASSYAIFAGNTVYSNSLSGIYIKDNHGQQEVAETQMIQNNIHSNQGYGILLSKDHDVILASDMVLGQGGNNDAGDIGYEDIANNDTSLVLINSYLYSLVKVDTTYLNDPGAYVISYNQNGSSGTVKIWGDYRVETNKVQKFNYNEHLLNSALSWYPEPVTDDVSTETEIWELRCVSPSPDAVFTVRRGTGTVFYEDNPGTATEGFEYTSDDRGVSFIMTGDYFYDGDTFYFVTFAATGDKDMQKTVEFYDTPMGTRLTVETGGELQMAGTSDYPTISTSGVSGNYYGIVSSGTLNLSNYVFSGLNSDGLTIYPSALVVDLSSGTYDNIQASVGDSAYIRVSGITSEKTFNNCVFDDTPGTADYNIRASGDGIKWTFNNWSGERGGSGYTSAEGGAEIYWEGESIPPEVGITSPADGEFYNELSQIEGTASSDIEISTVSVKIKRLSDDLYWFSGTEWSVTETWNEVFELYPSSWTLTSVPAWVDGSSYTVVAKAQDTSGNWSVDYATVTFTFDETAPSVPDLISPEDNFVTNQTTITFNWSGSSDDVSGISNYDLQVSASADFSGIIYSSSPVVSQAEMTLNENFYYWRVRAKDNAGNYSAFSSTSALIIDITPPSAITDLTAVAGAGEGQITLSWTAPGNDGYEGTAAEYIIKYATVAFTDENWDDPFVRNLSEISTLPEPAISGTIQEMTVTGLIQGTSYWFAVKSKDKADNISPINSNGVQGMKAGYVELSVEPASYDFGILDVGTSSASVTALILGNNGNIGVAIEKSMLNSGAWNIAGDTSTIDGFNFFATVSEVPPALSGYDDSSEISSLEEYGSLTEAGGTTQVSLMPDESANLWFRIDMPGTVSSGEQQTITVRLRGGSVEEDVTIAVTPATTFPPIVGITHPVDGEYYNEMMQIDGTADSDAGVSTVAVRIQELSEGYYWAGEGSWTESPDEWHMADGIWTSSWTLSTIPEWQDGVSYEIVAKAQDTSGTWSTVYATATFTYDIKVPTSAVTFPVDGGQYPEVNYIQGTAYDEGVGVDLVEVSVRRNSDNRYWDGSSYDWVTGEQYNAAVGISTWSYNAAAVRHSGGSYTVTSRAKDNAGNLEVAVSSVTYQIISSTGDWVSVSADGSYTLAVKQDGTLWSWGHNDYGQLGLGDSEVGTERITPAQVGTETDWVSISAGYFHAMAIKQDGTLWSWGRNDYGQLGLGDTVDKSTPTQVGADTDWVSVSGGFEYTLAIKQSGTLWSWGRNEYGQLGQGDSGVGTERNTPAQVGTETNWVSVSAGTGHSLVVKQDGTLWAWGANEHSQLGLGDQVNKSTPTQVGEETDWIVVSGGNRHTLAVKQNGEIWSWGCNENGKLGLGDDTEDKSTPTRVGTESNWVSVSAGTGHTLAFKQDGTLWSWGSNMYGQLGLGDTASKNIPTQVGEATNWVSVSGGHFHRLAVRQDGTPWSWGLNNYGQLGLGDKTQRLIPTRLNFSIPSGPTEFSGAAVSAGSIKWSWVDNADNESGYRVIGGTVNISGYLPPGTTSYTETGLSANTSYYRNAEAYNSGGSSLSAASAVWTLANPPTETQITQISSTTVTLNWLANDNPGWTRWGILHSTDNFVTSTTTLTTFVSTQTATTYIASDLSPLTSYWFKVNAFNEDAIATAFDTTITTVTLPGAQSESTFDFVIRTTDTVQNFAFRVYDAVGFEIEWSIGAGFIAVPDGDQLLTNEYAAAGDHTIRVRGKAERISFRGDWGGGEGFDGTPELLRDILTPVYPGVTGITSAYQMFAGAIGISSFTATDFFDIASSSVTDMSVMFSSTSFNQDISGWDTSGVENMAGMFENNSVFNQSIGGWNVSAVNNMGNMFHGASSFIGNISTWNVSGVTNMSNMFGYAQSFNGDISGWDVSSVTDMSWMLQATSEFDQDISGWDVSGVMSFEYFLFGAKLSNENYDALLINWSHRLLESTVPFNGGNSQYSLGLPSERRQYIIDTFAWNIVDVGHSGSWYNTPGGLNGTPISFDSILWEWDITPGATYYHVYDASDDSLLKSLAGKNTTSWIETDLQVQTTYYRYVRAGAEGVLSGASGTAQACILLGAPEVNITTPSQPYLNLLGLIEGIASAEAVLVEVRFKRSDGIYWDGDGWTTSEIHWFTADLVSNVWTREAAQWESGSEYEINARAQNSVGDWSVDYSTVTFIYDTEAPEVVLLSPSDSVAFSTDSVTTSWYFVAHGPSGLVDFPEVRVDEGEWEVIDSTWTHTFSGLSSGDVTLWVRISDNAGNIGEAGVTATIDIVDPVVSITSPGDSDVFHTDSVTVIWVTEPGPSGIDFHEVKAGEGEWEVIGSTWTHTFSGLPAGEVTLWVRATDGAGNSGEGSVSVLAGMDFPEAEITVPADGSFLSSLPEVSGTASATDGQDITDVEIRIQRGNDSRFWNEDEQISNWVPGAETWNEADWHGSSWTFSGALEWEQGSYIINARARDTLGIWSAVYSTVTFTLDSTPPVSAISYPEEGGSYEELAIITGAANDEVSGVDRVGISLKRISDERYWDGSHWVPYEEGGVWVLASGASEWQYDEVPASWSTGTYTLQSRAVDAAGNYEASGPVITFLMADYVEPVVDQGTISGTITQKDGTPVTGVLIEAVRDGLVRAQGATNTEGYYELAGLIPSLYLVRATWEAVDIISSVESQSPAGTADFDFRLEVSYELSEIEGVIALARGTAASSDSAGGQRALALGNAPSAMAYIELSQRNVVKARVPVNSGGRFSIPNLLPGRYVARAFNGSAWSDPLNLSLGEGQVLNVSFGFPLNLVGFYCYPNPSSLAPADDITIRYDAAADHTGTLSIYTLNGDLVRQYEIDAPAGVSRVTWDKRNSSGREVASGVYFIVLRTENSTKDEVKVKTIKAAVIR